MKAMQLHKKALPSSCHPFTMCRNTLDEIVSSTTEHREVCGTTVQDTEKLGCPSPGFSEAASSRAKQIQVMYQTRQLPRFLPDPKCCDYERMANRKSK